MCFFNTLASTFAIGQVSRPFLLPVLICFSQGVGIQLALCVTRFLTFTTARLLDSFLIIASATTKESVSARGSTSNSANLSESVSPSVYVYSLGRFSTTDFTFFYTCLILSVPSSAPAFIHEVA